jgi:hypothetical protein
MAIQDKFAVGPVTLVQLVGLAASPRIPSVRTDGAVRAADSHPTSAAAGLGGDAQEPVATIVSSYFALKVAPTLGLSADSLRAHISVEAGLDRPDPSSAANAAPSIDPSTFHHISTDTGTPAPLTGPSDVTGTTPEDPSPGAKSAVSLASDGRSGATDSTAAASDATSHEAGIKADGEAVADHYVFDGQKTFGDDQILDFTLAANDDHIAAAATREQVGGGDTFDIATYLLDFVLGDAGTGEMIGLVGDHSPPLLPASDAVHLAEPVHLASGSDTIPVI